VPDAHASPGHLRPALAAVALAALAVALAGPPPPGEAGLALEAGRCLETGQWLLQWAPGALGGHGSPLFLFRPQAGPYVLGLLVFAGLGGAAAVRLGTALAALAAAGAALRLGDELWGDREALALAATVALVPAGAAPRPDALLAAAAGLLALIGARGLPAAGRWLLAVAGIAGVYLALGTGGLPELVVVLALAAVLAPAAGRSALAGAVAAAAGLTAYHWLPALMERGAVRPAPPPSPGPIPIPALALAAATLVAAAALGLSGRASGARHRGAWIVALVALLLTCLRAALSPAGGLTVAGVLALGLAAAGIVGMARGTAGALGATAAVAAGAIGVALLGGGAPAALPAPVPAPVHRLPPPTQGTFLLPGPCNLGNLRSGSDQHFADVDCPAAAVLRSPVLAFPGWTVTVDNRPVAAATHPVEGTLEIPVPAGLHRVQLELRETPPRIAGRALSLLAAVAAIAFAVLRSGAADGDQSSRNSSGN
jgi:hypothetical protein